MLSVRKQPARNQEATMIDKDNMQAGLAGLAGLAVEID